VGLEAALGALLGVGAADASAKQRGKTGEQDRKPGSAGKPDAEGPCKSTKRPDNICTRDKQCCTGYCDTSTGKKNKDGKGRCRYLKQGERCTKGQQCAPKLACQDGTCRKAKAVPTGARCAKGETCAVKGAVCTTYDADGAPSGTYCTLPLGTSCTGDPECTCYSCGIANPETRRTRGARAQADLVCCGKDGIACTKNSNCCTGWSCTNGVCTSAATCTAADANVCADPQACPYQTVQSAIDDLEGQSPVGLIRIAAGTYDEDLQVSESVTIEACGAVMLRNATSGSRTIQANAAPTERAAVPVLTLKNVVVTSSTAPGSGGGIIAEGFDLALEGTTSVTGNSWPRQGGGIYLQEQNGSMIDWYLTLNDASAVENNTAGSDGCGIFVAGEEDESGRYVIVMNDDSSVRNNTGTVFCDGAVALEEGGKLIMNDRSSIANNTITQGRYSGGGVYAYADGMSTINIEMHDDSAISGNTVTMEPGYDKYGEGGGGVMMYNWSGSTTLTMDGNATISGNTTNGYGGGVLIGTNADGTRPAAELTMSGNATITGNVALAGGAIMVDQSYANYPAILAYTPASIAGNTPSGDQCQRSIDGAAPVAC
jgi:hypothetical protein